MRKFPLLLLCLCFIPAALTAADLNTFLVRGTLATTTTTSGFDPAIAINIVSVATSPATPFDMECREGEMAAAEWLKCVSADPDDCIQVSGVTLKVAGDYVYRVRSFDFSTKCTVVTP